MDLQDKTSSGFLCEVPGIDWITLTTFEGSAWGHWNSIMQEAAKVEKKEDKAGLYEGYAWATKRGRGFIGSGLQAGRDHIMLRCGGMLSNELHNEKRIRQGILEGWSKCTRVDLQITARQQEGWSQWRFFNRAKKSGFLTNIISSMSGLNNRELSTVYIGSRSSDVMVRVYQKEDEEGNLYLRFEIEMKGAKSKAVYRAICRGEIDIGSLILHRLQIISDNQLSAHFESLLSDFISGDVKPEKIVKSISKTEKWLLDTVLPAFTRVVNSHESDGTVLLAFLDAAMKAVRVSDIESIGDHTWPIE